MHAYVEMKRAIDFSMKYDYLTKELPHSKQMAIENISAFVSRCG
jgi:hypothetical protein